MTLVCQSEPLEPIIPEIEALAPTHWQETADYKNVRKYDPDWGIFLETEKKGRLFCVSARDGDKLVGYVVGYYGTETHCKGRWIAIADAYYMVPEYRGHAMFVVRYVERLVFGHPEHPARDLRFTAKSGNRAASFFEAMGYSNVGTIWSRLPE